MTVAVAHNDSPEGQAALRLAVAEARRRDEPLVVLHVSPHGGDRGGGAQDGLRAGVEAGLAEAGVGDLPWDLRVVPADGNTADALVDLVAVTGASLLVIGARRRTAVGKFLLGSTVQRVVLDCPAPVFVTKAGLPD